MQINIIMNVTIKIHIFTDPFTNQQNLPTPRKILDADQLAELQQEIWYHGQISRAEAERRLINDGEFLVRETPNSEGQYVLSGILDNTKKHLLLIDPAGVVSINIFPKHVFI